MSEPIEAFPLCWPTGRPRTPHYQRESARFDTSFARVRNNIVREVELLTNTRRGIWGNAGIIISTNIPLRRDGLPLFWRVKIERFGIDMAAAQRQQGLGLMIGGALAMHMGPDEDLAHLIHETTLTVCETCAAERDLPVAALAEYDAPESAR